MNGPRILRVSGSLAEASPLRDAALYELVRVGARGLLGEVVRVVGERATVQVYEDTSGLAVGEPVQPTGHPLRLKLGPGLLGSVLDGVGRPLGRIAEHTGDFIAPGVTAPTLDDTLRWSFAPALAPGTLVEPGDVLGTVLERGHVEHRVMIPHGTRGTLTRLAAGEFTVADVVGTLSDGTPLFLAHEWPVREPRPSARRLAADAPFLTGQRVFDFLFPVAEGGSVAVPGGFGTGKTVIEQSLAKYGAADVIVYIGCGERGNEMAEVLEEFPRLTDPRTGRSMLDRTVLVVNTSNMPVAAREASVYVGMTIAEYYRDMGYRVAVMADSLSRWAEALREIGARLQEMPGEEGYPTYLGNRLGKFYERAGRVVSRGRPERTGAVTLISAISPPGGDFSEPVTQASLRVAGALWALDPALAHQRQFPAVDWETSYSLHAERLAEWFSRAAGPDWPEIRRGTLELMQRDRELREIASLIGPEALQDRDRLLLDAARIIRETVLGQSAYDPNDAYSPLEKTYRLAGLAWALYRGGMAALERGAAIEHIDLGAAQRALAAARRAAPDQLEATLSEAQAAVSRVAEAHA
ncbi:MAG TPA: V-type ATP synthase subunit A [Gemmatimonadales bacterium]|nr:V-type ATP synthase subunit A [Gemmatimonadales bacterium]